MGNGDDNVLALLNKIEDNLADLLKTIKKINYVENGSLVQSTRKVLWVNLFAGMIKGFGFAVGATILGALLLMLLFRLADLNLPLVGEFIAKMVKIVQNHL